MKLIDRGKIPYYCHVEGNGDGEYEYTDIAYRTEIESLPVVDAEPVRHGKWKHWARMIICSECGTALYDDVIKCFRGVPRYCPECGAKMGVEQEKADKNKSYFPKGFFSKERPLAKGEEDEID